jgi:hypothetical protein
MKEHLVKCDKYQKKQQDKARKQGNLLQTTLHIVPKAPIKRLLPQRVHDLYKLAGYAIYCGARPFSLFQEPNMRAFITSFKSAYTPPDRISVGSKLLIECYNETRTEVLENIRSSNWINVSLNESSTITRERVINYCIIINAGCFCMKQAPVATGPSIAKL